MNDDATPNTVQDKEGNAGFTNFDMKLKDAVLGQLSG
jgi:hypothetical protein